MTEISPLETFKDNVKIQHEWNLEYFYDPHGYYTSKMYSKSFISEALPNVTFNVSCGETKQYIFTLAICKTSCEPAKAHITIHVNSVKKTFMEVDNWRQNYILIDIPLQYNSNGSFKFLCEIIGDGFYDSARGLHHHMEHFLTTPDFNDLVLKIDNNEIPVHKVILAAYSPVFSAMFKADMRETKENEIVIKDIEFDIMKKVIEFMYSGKVDSKLSVDNVLSMLYVADKYGIVDLKKLCGELLISKISIYNVFKIFEHANLYQTPDLIAGGLLFMKTNKHIITQSEDFMTLYLTKPELLRDFFIESIAECPKKEKL